MFSDLGLFILLSLFLWKKAKDYQDQDLWDFKTTLTVYQGSAEYSSTGLHRQFILLIDFTSVLVVYIIKLVA